MAKGINAARRANLKHDEPRMCHAEARPAEMPARPVCGALIELERRCGNLEEICDKLAERLEFVLYPGATGSGLDSNDPAPVVSPVVESINRASDRLGSLADRLECLIGRIEC